MNGEQSQAEIRKSGGLARPDETPSIHDIFQHALRCHQTGRLSEAERLYRQILQAYPRHVDTLHLLGVLAHQAGRPDIASDLIAKAIAENGQVPAFHNNLGFALQDQGKLEAAVASYERALAQKPDYAEAHYNLGNALKAQGKLDEAVASYGQAVTYRPADAEVHSNLGFALMDQGKLTAAVASFGRAVAHKADYADAHYNLGIALQAQGQLEEAIIRFRRAVELRPDYKEASHNVLMSLHYLTRYSNVDFFAEAQQFGRKVEHTFPSRDFDNTPDPHRRLRIGYVSADFRAHPVAYFLARVLACHDHRHIEVFCYSNSTVIDAMTARLRESADHWRTIADVTDNDVETMIRQDSIDILVDLSGHTAQNRLPLFARRPAPVQVSWLGYFGTTGLSAIDYVMADRFVVPVGEEAYFTEKIWRLPDCYLCYSPPELDIPVGPFPALANGFVTFGCFNNGVKISDETIAAWAVILGRVEGSRLFLKNRSLNDADCRTALFARFAAQGIARDRLLLEGHAPLAEALAAYNKVDIALDPFPFGGGTTTAETLWMGVPLVTRQGARWVGRMSQSILAALDLSDGVARDVNHYIDIACRMANDLPQRAEQRAGLRQRLENSRFCDGSRFARVLETAYRGMWAGWCMARTAERE